MMTQHNAYQINTIKCCRMLNSRTYYMAGGNCCVHHAPVRLSTLRDCFALCQPFVRELIGSFRFLFFKNRFFEADNSIHIT